MAPEPPANGAAADSSSSTGEPPQSLASADPARSADATSAQPISIQGTSIQCGSFTCWRFETAADAITYLLTRDAPLVLGVGESHALESNRHIASATSRFANELLPALAPRTSDLIVELLAPPNDCEPTTTQEVQREEQKIVEGQATTNQNQFVALGHRARELTVVPWILRASCADLTAIAEAGEDGVLVMMETIARLTTLEAQRALSRQATKEPRLVVAYGGALHNDLTPRPERELWSYGPALTQMTASRYTALDLIVPEHIQDTPSWRAFPWFDAVPELTDQDVVLMQLAARDWVLFFPTGVRSEPDVRSDDSPQHPQNHEDDER